MRWQPSLGAQVELDRYRRTAAQRSERPLQATLRQDRGVNPVGDLPQLVRNARQPLGNARERALELVELRGLRRLRRAQLQPARDEPLLDAVVQIALDPPPRLIRGGDDPRPRGHQLGVALRVRDRRGDELREARETRFGVPRERLVGLLRVDEQNAPQPPLDNDRAADRGADPELFSNERGDVPENAVVVVYPDGSAR